MACEVCGGREYFRSTLDHGVAELYLPAKMSMDDIADFERLVEIIARRLRRRAMQEASSGDESVRREELPLSPSEWNAAAEQHISQTTAGI